MEQFRKTLIEVINSSDLPFEARYYILKDVYRDVAELYEKALMEQAQAEFLAQQASVEGSTEVEEVE